MPPKRPKPTQYEQDTLERALQTDVIKCAQANGWRYDVEDCQTRWQKRSSFFLSRHFRGSLQKPLQFLLGRRKQLFTLVYHTHDSRGSQAGFPDLVLVHPRRAQIIFCELKKEGNYPTTEQRLWLSALENATNSCDNIQVVTWRPSDWDEIVATLGGINTKLFV